jgi:hypothetical protein
MIVRIKKNINFLFLFFCMQSGVALSRECFPTARDFIVKNFHPTDESIILSNINEYLIMVTDATPTINKDRYFLMRNQDRVCFIFGLRATEEVHFSSIEKNHLPIKITGVTYGGNFGGDLSCTYHYKKNGYISTSQKCRDLIIK